MGKVFVSYSHDTPEHAARVLDFANSLRDFGVHVELDRFHVRPTHGWPHWCEEQLRPDVSEYVLVVCTKTYRERVENKVAADEGRGVYWEGALIHQYIYNEKANDRFIPVLIDGAIEDDIPMPLQSGTRYRITRFDFADRGFDNLYCELTHQNEDLKAQLGQIVDRRASRRAPTKKLDPLPECYVQTTFAQVAPTRLRHGATQLFGREKELKLLDDALADLMTRIVTFVAWGGVGKTSLVVEWMNRQAAAGWPGVDRVFDWSFYSQGTRDQTTASADSFVKAALEFFGDKAMAESNAGAWEKGARLAQLVGAGSNLLGLDGLEPLQYPPGPMAGQLKDPALQSLLKGLARQTKGGLCVVTTRESVEDLASFRNITCPEHGLENLSMPAGVELLKACKVKGTVKELEDLVKEVDGHALTISLLGTFLAKAHKGDIRKLHEVDLARADKVKGGHAFKTIGAYECWLAGGGKDGERQRAVLQLMGLFDRPADAGCIAALRQKPVIKDLTKPLVGLSDVDWNLTLSALEDCKLLTQHPNGALDAHPLIREYFAKQLQEKHAKAWQAAHQRLYEHLTTTTKEGDQPTLDDLQPLYQAVAHGCQAGIHDRAFKEVFYERVDRRQAYGWKKLGAFGATLGAVACFFERPWSRLDESLSGDYQAWLLNEAALGLRALGRLEEALEPMRAGLDARIQQESWLNAARSASNLSELELTLGRVPDAVADAEHGVEYADRSDDAFLKMALRTALADALHQAGQAQAVHERFVEAEGMQAKRQPEYPRLYSLAGIRFCDLLLAPAERAAGGRALGLSGSADGEVAARLEDGRERAAEMKKDATASDSLLDLSLYGLALARVALYRGLLGLADLSAARDEVEQAVAGLRRAGQVQYVPFGLLTRAWFRAAAHDLPGAQIDLDEAWEIAERGPMRLLLADIHLYRARLFFRDRASYPWPGGPAADLAAARKLIEDCGYGRRLEELADAERVILAQ